MRHTRKAKKEEGLYLLLPLSPEGRKGGQFPNYCLTSHLEKQPKGSERTALTVDTNPLFPALGEAQAIAGTLLNTPEVSPTRTGRAIATAESSLAFVSVVLSPLRWGCHYPATACALPLPLQPALPL